MEFYLQDRVMHMDSRSHKEFKCIYNLCSSIGFLGLAWTISLCKAGWLFTRVNQAAQSPANFYRIRGFRWREFKMMIFVAVAWVENIVIKIKLLPLPRSGLPWPRSGLPLLTPNGQSMNIADAEHHCCCQIGVYCRIWAVLQLTTLQFLNGVVSIAVTKH